MTHPSLANLLLIAPNKKTVQDIPGEALLIVAASRRQVLRT